MPSSNLKIIIGSFQIEVTDPEDLPVSIDYALEDSENFEQKKSATAFDIDIPATLKNDIAGNTFRNAGIEDMTTGQIFKGNLPCVIESNGYELLTGKAILKSATHNDKPLSYKWNLFGDNADWLISLKDKNLFDFLQNITFTFDRPTIIASWQFDGTDELLPYVFAPIRFRTPMGGTKKDASGVFVSDDDNVEVDYLRPSISKYWIIYWAFKSLGYKISSTFLDLEYFRRQVCPWVWTNFLDSDGTALEKHKFLAKSTEDQYFEAERGAGSKIDQWIDMKVTNDSTNGAFDNNNDYTYDDVNFEMIWTYNAPDFGPLSATFSMIIFYIVAISGQKSDMEMFVQWFIDGVYQNQTDIIIQADSNGISFPSPIPIGFGTQRPSGQTEIFFTTPVPVTLGQTVSAKVHLRLYRDKASINDVCHIQANVLQFQLDYFRIPVGGTINFANYTGLQKYKFIDFLAGVIDEFDLSINTDSINKVVVIEPTHPYSITADPTATQDGYFKNDHLDWNGKEDLSKEWQMDSYADTEKELIIKYKDDTNDGILKLIQDRNITKLAAGKYVFPDRFQTGVKERENRFFSPTMHYDAVQWKGLGTGANTNISPQLVCIIPENISNTSESAADNVFNPKSCYYKGLVTGAGAWRFDRGLFTGDGIMQEFPFMFAVNYQIGGENDPILSYSDENISGVIGTGLLKRFYWQRLAIMRNGQYYNSWFRLKNIDVANQMHREFKSYLGQRWELIQVKGYKPLLEESTSCLLYKWSPITVQDFSSTYPSNNSVLTGENAGSPDTKYSQLKCLTSDVS